MSENKTNIFKKEQVFEIKTLQDVAQAVYAKVISKAYLFSKGISNHYIGVIDDTMLKMKITMLPVEYIELGSSKDELFVYVKASYLKRLIGDDADEN